MKILTLLKDWLCGPSKRQRIRYGLPSKAEAALDKLDREEASNR